MTRKVLWPVLVIGVLLIVLPFAFHMPSRTAAGARMMSRFQPIMQADQVQKTADYYYNVFVPLGKVAPAINEQTVAKFDGYVKGFGGVQTDAQKLVPALAQAMHMTPAQVQAFMGKQLPSMAAMIANLPTMQKDFSQFIGMMQANTGRLRPGERRPRPLQAARGHDAGERDRLPVGEQPAVVPAVHVVLRDPGPAALPARRLRALVRASRARPHHEGAPDPGLTKWRFRIH